MNKDFAKKMDEITKIAFELIKCSNQNCTAQKNKMMANKKAATLYIKYKTESNRENKIKLLDEIYKNKIIYEYNKCMIKNCKTIYNDIIKFLRSLIAIIPHTNPISKELENMITELEKIYNKDNLTQNEFKIFGKNVAKLMSAINNFAK